MSEDRATGRMPREVLASLVNAPFGQAEKVIEQYEAGGPEWEVTFECTIEGTAIIQASTKKAAEDEARKLSLRQIDWDEPRYDGELLFVRSVKSTLDP